MDIAAVCRGERTDIFFFESPDPVQLPPPFSELLRVLLHALVLSKLHQFPGGSAHVDRSGSGRGQVIQGLPDETHGVVATGACSQLHGQAEAAHDGDGGGSPHLPGRARGESAWRGSLCFWCRLHSSSIHEHY